MILDHIIPLLSDLHKFYYLEKDIKKYNICDKNKNSIVFNNTYNVLQSCVTYDDFSCEEVSNNEIIDYTYDDFERDDGIKFINNGILCHANKILKRDIEYMIKKLFMEKKTYGNGYYSLVNMLFILNGDQIIVRDNFNILNVMIFNNSFPSMIDYMSIDIDEYDKNSIELNDSVNLYLKGKKYAGNTIEIFKYIVQKEVDISIEDIIGYIVKKEKYSRESLILFGCHKALLTFFDELEDFNLTKWSKSYKFCEIGSKLKNFNMNITQDNYDKLKDVVILDDKIFERKMIVDMVCMKFLIETNEYRLSSLILDKIYGYYYFFILEKSNKLFPISIKSQIDSYFNQRLPNQSEVERYRLIRSGKPILKVVDTLYFETILNNSQHPKSIAGCGESCVYNYFNELLYDGNIINVSKFPEKYKHTPVYKFYLKHFPFLSDARIEDQNNTIMNTIVFSEFAHMMFYSSEVEYFQNGVEIIPTTKNIYNIIHMMLGLKSLENIGDLKDLLKLTYFLCGSEEFNKKEKNISIKNSTFIFNNLTISPSDGHCSSGQIIAFSDTMPYNYGFYYILNKNVQTRGCDNVNCFMTLRLINNDEVFIRNVLLHIDYRSNIFQNINILKDVIEPLIDQNEDVVKNELFMIIVSYHIEHLRLTDDQLYKWSLNNPLLYRVSKQHDDYCKTHKGLDVFYIDKLLNYKFTNYKLRKFYETFEDVCKLFNIEISKEKLREYYGRYEELEELQKYLEILKHHPYYDLMFKRSYDLSPLTSRLIDYYLKYYFLYTTDIDELAKDIIDIYCYDKNVNNIFYDMLEGNDVYNPIVTDITLKKALLKIDVSYISKLMLIKQLCFLYIDIYHKNCDVLNEIKNIIDNSDYPYYHDEYKYILNEHLEQC